ncbi:uncharacterized protein K444DRAFT_621043 [Hyaloscypha bicolor E]|uniref:Uncharacterized protein n=1 Tax=Hyaloscypha bicolor E TaxID=1095630 RepID=A0A2J6SMB9_9HELO|nr:uncharacterized protein K444DRAFT_621043 [Hyaloscypha bicolor E]PMD51914.1 hypothetical protein K444DRAFT_621043 [Hyaloscypha bicolor E]
MRTRQAPLAPDNRQFYGPKRHSRKPSDDIEILTQLRNLAATGAGIHMCLLLLLWTAILMIQFHGACLVNLTVFLGQHARLARAQPLVRRSPSSPMRAHFP